LSEALTVAGGLANILVSVTAALALYLAWRQIKISRELSALEAYEKYHEMCLQFPQFGSGHVDYEQLSKSDSRAYVIWVLYTLMIGERIFALFPKDEGWCFSIMDDIRMHRKFIASEHFAYHLQGQGWTITPLIKRVLDEQ
jgi:hypothetical protein